MLQATRRGFLGLGLTLAIDLANRAAHATLVRGLPLSALVQRSERIALIEPLDAVCLYAQIGGRRSIVTDTHVRIHEHWALAQGAHETELTLRTLGGRLDGVGELVHGQPVLEAGVRGLVFLKLGRDGKAWWTTGMAQGHFPLSGGEETSLLLPSPGLPSIAALEASAVKLLVGRQVREARELTRKASPQ
jgi:hypothetical protein